MATSSHPQSRNKLLNHILDDIARDDPSKVFAEIPLSLRTFADGFRKVTYRELSNAVDGIAAHLENAIGKGTSVDTLAYVGLQDLRYVILLLGAVKAGYNMLFFSPRFPPLAAAELFRQSGTNTLLVANPRLPFLASIIGVHPMVEVEIPSLDTLLNTQYPHYTYDVSFEESRNHPLVTVHTSGSAAFPKPIVITHGWVASFAEELYLKAPEGYESTTKFLLGTKLFSQFPFFHTGFLMGNVLFPLLTDTVVVYPLAALPPSGNMVADVLDHNKVDIVCLIPTVIEQIRRDPDLLNRISAKVSRMMWSGGDIPAQAGDALSSRFELFNQMGATELGLFHQIAPAGKWGGSNWHYLGFHPDSNVRFVHREGEVYEAVIRRKDHGYTQTIFHVFPDKQEYATGDLYKMHPTEPDLWDFQGRNDDMIVLASSEKFWPVAVEKLIVQHPNVRDAVVIGTGRVRPVLLLDVESAQNVGLEKVLADVWPVIEATHAICSPAARIQKEFIVVVDPARPLVRTAKGNVQRAATTKLYADDLARLDEKVRVAAPAAAMEVLAEGTRM